MTRAPEEICASRAICEEMAEPERVFARRPDALRSARWFAPDTLRAMGQRSRLKQMGFASEDYAGKPVIGILNTWSDANPCHQHLRDRAQDVKRGVLQAGGFPLEIPALSPGETFMKPTAMLYRNLLALETEELARANPLDGVVLLGGCDKSVPGLVMGAISADLPAIFVAAGPMLRGRWRGETLASGTDVWRYWAERRAGTIDGAAWDEIEDGIARSYGTCMTMGTASTMAAAVEALGLSLPGTSSIPAADSQHERMMAAAGRRIVEMVWENATPSSLLTAESFDNAITVVLALGGSTNAIIHLIAMARRAGIALDLDRFEELSARTPILADVLPTGRYLMEDFFYAGGLRALMARLADLLALDARTVAGVTVGEALQGAPCYDDEVIRPREKPLSASGGLAILRGNLAPDGAVIKHGAADPALLVHRGRAVVFDSYEELQRRIDDPALDVDADSVLVLRNAGPKGAPGMPEWGMLPIPRKLLQRGVRDMVRISDARMSGTSYGTCVLHVAPEAHVGGPLALVEEGDLIELDVPTRRLTLLVDDAVLAQRRARWKPRPEPYARGYTRLHLDHVTQANRGCDYDFLEFGAKTPEPEIY